MPANLHTSTKLSYNNNVKNYIYLMYSFSNRFLKEDHPKDVALFDRIRQAINCRLVVTDVMRLHRSTKITVGDLWTLIPPSEQTLREEKRVQESVPDYTPGWLTSTVCFINSFGNYLFIHLFIYLFNRRDFENELTKKLR